MLENSLKIKKFKLRLLKFESVKIVYITPTGQCWGICSNGIKKCIIKKDIGTQDLEIFLNSKKLISYKDSKLFKKGIKFSFMSEGIKVFLKTIIIIKVLQEIQEAYKVSMGIKKSFTFIDLFSGAGGFSFGLKNSGLEHIYGIDSWCVASESYKINIGSHVCEDLVKSKPNFLNKEVDILVGSPPCQTFSLANRRNANNLEEGSLLYLSFLKYLKFYKPKIFVLENVMGLLSYKVMNSKVIDDMIKAFSINYSVRVFKVCCSDFGVPQKRKRVLIIGVQKKFGVSFPDLKKNPCKKSLRYFLLDKKEVDSSLFLSNKAISGILRRQKVNSIKGYGYGVKYLNIDGFCNTITANYWKDGYSSLIKYSESEIRRLTEIEIKRIQSFPDTFNFIGSKKNRYIQIGNAVPPKLAYFLGKEIINFLKKQKNFR